MDRFQHRGLTVAYERLGRGPAVIFLHNGGASRRIWRPQMDALAGSFDVTALDLPGFGDSPLPATAVTLDDYEEMVASMIETLGLSPVAIVGNCMGSNIATGVAERHPELVRALVLINPLTEATFSAGWLGYLHKMGRVAPRLTGFMRGVTRRVPIPRPLAQVALRFQMGPAGTRLGLHKDPELLACNVRTEQLPALIDVLDDMSAYGRLDHERQIPEVPILTIWGGSNHVLSERSGRQLNIALRPDAEVVLGDCGHFPMLEDPDTVTEEIAGFLASVGPGARSHP